MQYRAASVPQPPEITVAHLLNRLDLPPFIRLSPIKMHTVDPSSDPSVPLVELSAPDLRVCRESALIAGTQASPQVGNRTTAGDLPLPACENNAKTGTDIPSWKRILDITCILLSLPFWLPVVIFVALWIKLVSPGPIFFRQ